MYDRGGSGPQFAIGDLLEQSRNGRMQARLHPFRQETTDTWMSDFLFCGAVCWVAWMLVKASFLTCANRRHKHGLGRPERANGPATCRKPQNGEISHAGIRYSTPLGPEPEGQYDKKPDGPSDTEAEWKEGRNAASEAEVDDDTTYVKVMLRELNIVEFSREWVQSLARSYSRPEMQEGGTNANRGELIQRFLWKSLPGTKFYGLNWWGEPQPLDVEIGGVCVKDARANYLYSETGLVGYYVRLMGSETGNGVHQTMLAFILPGKK